MKSLLENYAPKKLKEIVGQENAVKQIHDYLSKYTSGKGKYLLLYGPAGVGKTSSVHAAAQEFDLELIETNASQTRNKDQIHATIGQALKQRSLFGRNKLILIDEVDGIAGQADRGGMQALLELLEKSSYPVVLTCTNPFDNSFSNLRKLCVLVEFVKIPSATVFDYLKKICDKEHFIYDEGALKQLSRQSGGDLRGAINDLGTLAARGKISTSLLEEVGFREQQDSMPSALTKIFKTTDLSVAATAFERVEEEQDEQFLWIDKNLPSEYTKPADLARAYNAMSLADIYRRRIRRWQHWRFMVYINSFLTSGIAGAKDEKYTHFVKYTPTGRLLKIWWANRKQEKKKKIAQKIAPMLHTSSKRVMQSTIPMLQNVYRTDKTTADHMTKYFDFDEEEIAWLKGKDKE